MLKISSYLSLQNPTQFAIVLQYYHWRCSSFPSFVCCREFICDFLCLTDPFVCTQEGVARFLFYLTYSVLCGICTLKVDEPEKWIHSWLDILLTLWEKTCFINHALFLVYLYSSSPWPLLWYKIHRATL